MVLCVSTQGVAREKDVSPKVKAGTPPGIYARQPDTKCEINKPCHITFSFAGGSYEPYPVSDNLYVSQSWTSYEHDMLDTDKRNLFTGDASQLIPEEDIKSGSWKFRFSVAKEGEYVGKMVFSNPAVKGRGMVQEIDVAILAEKGRVFTGGSIPDIFYAMEDKEFRDMVLKGRAARQKENYKPEYSNARGLSPWNLPQLNECMFLNQTIVTSWGEERTHNVAVGAKGKDCNVSDVIDGRNVYGISFKVRPYTPYRIEMNSEIDICPSIQTEKGFVKFTDKADCQGKELKNFVLKGFAVEDNLRIDYFQADRFDEQRHKVNYTITIPESFELGD